MEARTIISKAVHIRRMLFNMKAGNPGTPMMLDAVRLLDAWLANNPAPSMATMSLFKRLHFGKLQVVMPNGRHLLERFNELVP